MADEASSPAKREINWKLVSFGALALLLVVFALVNTHEVDVDYIIDTVSTPMIVVIVIAAVVGFALGALFMHHRDSKKSG